MDPDQQGDVLYNTRSSFSLSPVTASTVNCRLRVVDVVPVNAWLQSDCVSTAWRETGSLQRKSSSSCQRSGCGSTDWAHDACTELCGGGSVALGPCVSKRIWCSFTRCCGDKVAPPPLSVFIYLLFLSEKPRMFIFEVSERHHRVSFWGLSPKTTSVSQFSTKVRKWDLKQEVYSMTSSHGHLVFCVL